MNKANTVIILLSGFLVLGCGKSTGSSGLFSKNSYCTTTSCTSAVAGQSIRLNIDPSVIITDLMTTIQISGVCSQGDAIAHEITAALTNASAIPENGSIRHSKVCDAGRFYVTITRPVGAPAYPAGYSTFTVTVILRYGVSAVTLADGPRYTSNFTIQYPLRNISAVNN